MYIRDVDTTTNLQKKTVPNCKVIEIQLYQVHFYKLHKQIIKT